MSPRSCARSVPSGQSLRPGGSVGDSASPRLASFSTGVGCASADEFDPTAGTRLESLPGASRPGKPCGPAGRRVRFSPRLRRTHHGLQPLCGLACRRPVELGVRVCRGTGPESAEESRLRGAVGSGLGETHAGRRRPQAVPRRRGRAERRGGRLGERPTGVYAAASRTRPLDRHRAGQSGRVGRLDQVGAERRGRSAAADLLHGRAGRHSGPTGLALHAGPVRLDPHPSPDRDSRTHGLRHGLPADPRRRRAGAVRRRGTRRETAACAKAAGSEDRVVDRPGRRPPVREGVENPVRGRAAAGGGR